ncbi:hypothetical protein QMK19_03495 [Streptomyces sp. H10-C2]|uniref:hypothetical protein n=1 Tax=unclassified Streptomyces TaxID=2593676 RepID=UPI0024BB69EE|nr:MULTISPECIES: hypothetical protein [unclassified Streptomyces]MDJ0342251.1 hypothetical protein [Streptomyces sp. PH10-H1]MDJ0368765.1 hypothetical protein [Streptomyces sp. H10-C2]
MIVVYELPEGGWTGASNAILRTLRLTVRARGLLMLLLSYPSPNDITIAKIAAWNAKARRETGVPLEGRESLQAAMRELEREGFVVHDKSHDKESGRWSTKTYVSANPESIARYAPSTALPRAVDRYSGNQSSVDPYSASQSLSTYNTEGNTEDKTADEEGGLQYSSSLASAREGQHAGKQDLAAEFEAAMEVRYEGVRQTDQTYLRDRLLKFERKRPAVYRKYRNAAISQVERGQHPERIAEVGASRVIDELSMMYAVRHYALTKSGVPQWLIRLPLRSVG